MHVELQKFSEGETPGPPIKGEGYNAREDLPPGFKGGWTPRLTQMLSVVYACSWTCCTYFTRDHHKIAVCISESASTALGTAVKRIGKIFDVRWLSSSFRSVDALLTSLPAVFEHLQQASGGSSQPAIQRAN